MKKLTGKTAIVTGASKGIGAGIAKALAGAGAAVIVNYSTSKEAADRLVGDIRSDGGQAVAIEGNVALATDVRRMFAKAKEAFGSVDILVNNAGVYRFEPIEDVTEVEFHREINTNVLGTILAIQEALKYFPAEGGSIINIGSIASENPVPDSVLYASTKGAVDTLTLALANELGHRNIRVNTVSPGHTETDGTHQIGLVGSERADQLASETPLGGRLGQPDDIAPTVVFLASDDAKWLTGERIHASGGIH
ncbi:3-oxoacyl-[acyl-carrier protein] reductase [Paenibacillus rhizosphaerae]|uniref:3-oxoacyl-[acyl-carrier protein] reductase n=1 Tax=Paenibacillus rhizosphaerae TaxID=297318 RepID=A0A839TIA0_9BACL|nr:glucose 1-dehydrogenase [Paenibacillus rhizosphaerae]MBB3125490.1 3-oxoacyl-[acyl-carrier protein] reductase [Paenibacillus rhizosphaerae]